MMIAGEATGKGKLLSKTTKLVTSIFWKKKKRKN